MFCMYVCNYVIMCVYASMHAKIYSANNTTLQTYIIQIP